MLLREDRRGAEHRHLQPVLHSLEGGPDRDLRLAVSHVAADQVVHGVRRLHGLLHGVDGLKLVAGLRVGKGVLHLVLPDGVRREGVAGEHLPRGVQRDELAGHLAGGPLRPLLGPRPLLAAEARQRRRVVAGRDVGREPVQVLRGHVELVALGVLQREVLALAVLTGDASHPGEAGDAMVDVDDVGAGHELREEGLSACCVPSKGAAALGVAEHLHVREDGQRAGLELQAHALLQRGRGQRDGAGRRRAANVVRQRRPDVVAAQHLLQPLRVVGEHDDALARPGAFLGVLCEGVQPAPEAGSGKGLQPARPVGGRGRHPVEVQPNGVALDALRDRAPRPPRRGPAVGQLAARDLRGQQRRRLLLQRLGLLRDTVRLQHGHHGAWGQVVQRAAVAQEAGVERRLADALPVVHALHVLPHPFERVRVDGAQRPAVPRWPPAPPG